MDFLAHVLKKFYQTVVPPEHPRVAHATPLKPRMYGKACAVRSPSNFGHGEIVHQGDITFPPDDLSEAAGARVAVNSSYRSAKTESSVNDKAHIVLESWSSVRPVKGVCELTFNYLVPRLPFNAGDLPVLCLSLFLPNDMLSQFNDSAWQLRYFVSQLKLILVF